LNLAEFIRAGEWTIFGLAPDQSGFVPDITTRILRDRAPFPKLITNVWIDADADLAWVANHFSSKPAGDVAGSRKKTSPRAIAGRTGLEDFVGQRRGGRL